MDFERKREISDVIKDIDLKEFGKIIGPRVGDFLLLRCGLITRLAGRFRDEMLTGFTGEFYFDQGSVYYHGEVNYKLPIQKIGPSCGTRAGLIWVKNTNTAGPGKISFEIYFRLFEEI